MIVSGVWDTVRVIVAGQLPRELQELVEDRRSLVGVDLHRAPDRSDRHVHPPQTVTG